MEFENFLQDKMRSLGDSAYTKFVSSELVYHWKELVNEEIYNNVIPIKVEYEVLLVEVENSAFKDQLKFFADDIINAVNERFGEGKSLVKEIRIAKSFQVPEMPPKESPGVEKTKLTPQDIVLSEEEIESCREKVQEVSDENLRKVIFQTLLSQMRYQKFRLANGWHKCSKCESLCAPEEILCEVCRIKEREVMERELFNILYDEPWLKPWEARELLLKKMPHMEKECSEVTVESTRSTLIQKMASKVRFGDEESDDVLKLVALEKRLPPEKLTPAIIRLALIDLQFDLPEYPKVQRYLFKSRQK